MKKLIAISVMCALVAGAAFAETSVGGQVFVGGALVKGTNVTDSQPSADAIENDRYNTALKITFSEGSAGGRIRILGNNAGGSDAFDEWFGWWRPIPQLRLQVGSNQDGDFGTAQISGWGFTGENKNNGGNQGAMGEYNGYQEGRNVTRTVGWYEGTGGTPNIQFTVNAIENLTINLWFPFTSANAAAPGFILSRFNLNLVYRFIDIGNLYVSFKGDTGYLEADPDSWYVTEQTGTPKAYLSFYLTAIENMAVDLGLAYQFPLENERTKTTTNYPFEVGLGYRVGSGDFTFKLRASARVGGSQAVSGGDTVNTVNDIAVNILPSYKIKTVTVFFYAGMGVLNNPEYKKVEGIYTGTDHYIINESDTIVSWFVNPYVFIPAGNLRFKVGIQVYSDGNQFMAGDGSGKRDAAIINWAVPFGFYTYF